MDKDSIERLLHTLIPFMVMAMLQRLILLVFGHIGIEGEMAELCAFIPASLAAILLFRIKTYHIYKEDERSETSPLQKRGTVFCLIQTLFTISVMVILMYAVSAFIGGTVSTSSQVIQASAVGVISTIIIHPFVEEYIFRHLFYGELRLLNPVFGCMMQAVMFAIIHNTVDSMAYALVSGIALGILYEQSGAIWTVIAAHLCINLRSYLYLTALSGHADMTQIIDTVLISVGCILFLIYCIFEGRKMSSYDQASEASDSGNGGSDA